MSTYPGFIGSSSRSQSPLANCERTVNLFVEPSDAQSGRPALYPIPGASQWFTATDVGTRALYQMNGRAFGVIGGGAYEFLGNRTGIRRGDVAQDGNPADIVTNGATGSQVMYGSGMNAYVMNLLTNVFTAAPVLTGEASQIGMLDGYGVAFNRTTGKVRVSALNDFTSWDPTQFAFRSSAPDNWQAMLTNAPDLWLIGEQSGDVWYDAGGTFPFAPRPGASFPYGIAATFSLKAAGDSVFWLSKNAQGAGVVVRARGYVPQPINTFAVDTAIARYQETSTIADAEGAVYQRAGHTFYVLNFPTANATWAYDLRTGLWAERGTWNPAFNRYDMWHPRSIMHAFGQHLIGDRATGQISKLDDAVGVEADGSPIRRLRIPPALVVQGNGRVFVDRFTLGIQAGVGTQTGQGQNPVAMLRVSKDFAQTFGSEQSRSIGRAGDTQKRVFWTSLGSSPISWVPEIVISDPVPSRIVSADIDARGLRSQAA